MKVLRCNVICMEGVPWCIEPYRGYVDPGVEGCSLLSRNNMNRLSSSAKYTHSTFAERVGFEPTVPLRIHYLSMVANSTTLASLQKCYFENMIGKDLRKSNELHREPTMFHQTKPRRSLAEGEGFCARGA